MPATQVQPTVEQTRAQALVSMGFTPQQAYLLAATKPGGRHVATDEVGRMLQAGCRHDTALRILM